MQYRSGTCSACGASFKIPASFPHDRARCEECGGAVEIGPVQSEEDLPAGLVPHVPSGRKRPGPSMKEQLLARRARSAGAPASVEPVRVEPVTPVEPVHEAPKTEPRRPVSSPRTAARPSAPATPRRTPGTPARANENENGLPQRDLEIAAEVAAADITHVFGEREHAASEHGRGTLGLVDGEHAPDGANAEPDEFHSRPAAAGLPFLDAEAVAEIPADGEVVPEEELATVAEAPVTRTRPARPGRDGSKRGDSKRGDSKRGGRKGRDRERAGSAPADAETADGETADREHVRGGRAGGRSGGRSGGKGKRSRDKGAEKKKLSRPALIGIVAVVVLGLGAFLFKDALFGSDEVVNAADTEATQDAAPTPTEGEGAAGDAVESAPIQDGDADADAAEPKPPPVDEGDETDEAGDAE